MDSPANSIETRDHDAETIWLKLINQAKVEEEVSVTSDTYSIPDDIRITELVSDEMEKSQEAEEVDGRGQKLEVSIEEDETDTMVATDSHTMSSSFNYRGGGPKRKKGNDKKRKQHEEKSKEKLKVLVKTLKLVPFKPFKLDFSRHETLLKTLGLWDFVHLEFDQHIDYDLVAQLIAYYSPEGRCSYINGFRIKLSRADLARALKLPNKKERIVILDEDKELLESDESILFVEEEVVSNWILLHCDDAWMMPDEVVEWKKDIKEKQLDKLDWAGLFWIMVERELKAEAPLGDCFYASHMQMVIRSQKKDLFREQAKVEDNDVKVEDSLIKSPEEDTPREQSRLEDIEVKEGNLKVNDDIAALNLRMDDGTSDTKEEKCVEESMIELNLGHENVTEMAAKDEHHHEKQPMDHKENKEEEDEKWLWNEDSNAGSHFLQGCDVGGTAGDEGIKTEGHIEMGENEALEDVDEDEIEEDGEKHDVGFMLFPNSETLHGIAQENFILGDTSPLGYNSGQQIHGSCTGDLLASRGGMHMVQGSSQFGNGNKKEIDHENNISYHFDNPATKRLKTDGWDDKPVPFGVCVEQIMQLADKAKLLYVEKDRACEESNMRQQMLLNELQRREQIIQQLHEETYEEQQRKDIEIVKLENELRMMTSVLAWYQKALKETQKACRKHRKYCLLRDKPMYEDVKVTGGLVLSTTEIEKLRLKEDEEEEGMRRALIERQVEEYGSLWIKEYEVNLNKKVELLEEKLTRFQNKVKLLKETISRRA